MTNNHTRGMRAERAIAAYVGCLEGDQQQWREDPQTTIGDMLGDVMHLCDQRINLSFEGAIMDGHRHHDQEINEEEI